MPSLLRLLVHPELRRPGPPPLRVDLRRVVLFGMAAWTLALVTNLVLLALGRVVIETVATCVAGILLGVVGLVWERRHRREYRGDD